MPVPNCLSKAFELAKFHLLGGTLVAIAETHTRPHGRVLAQHLLWTGAVSQFFVEYYPKNDQFKYQFADLEQRCGESPELKSAVEIVKAMDDRQLLSEFNASHYATPGIKQLVALALHLNINVNFCDEGIRATYVGTESIRTRDEKAAKEIAKVLQSAPLALGQGALLLWGQDHFLRHPVETPFEEQGLHKLIRKHAPGCMTVLVDVAELTDTL